jgi:hypothetical protein
LGTKLLDECSSSWNRTNDSSGTVTVAYVPYASDESLRAASSEVDSSYRTVVKSAAKNPPLPTQ